jgi:miniconductance mechanosensitive channel
MDESDQALKAAGDALQGTPSWWAQWLAEPFWGPFTGVLLLITGAALLHLLTQRLILRALDALFRRSDTWWDNVLMDQGVFRKLAWLIPILVIHVGTGFIPGLDPDWAAFVQRVASACAQLTVALALGGFLSAVQTIYGRYDISRHRPIKGYLQVVAILVWICATILIIATLMQQSPWYFLSGLGAMTAILLLVFRDTLLSLVAGIQLTVNDLIRVGDWIEMPQFGADGDVVDIGLNQVKVSNWDRTISVIPTHKFLENSFRNWRGMFEAGGRRIKRALNIDLNTVHFLSADEISRLGQIEVLGEYLASRQQEIAAWNQAHAGADELPINQRRLTNLGTFRAYVVAWLKRNPAVRADMSFLVRQLPPGPEGLPLELYFFVSETRWSAYEDIQSDIFDHLLSVLPEFGLRIYQRPAGSDFAGLAQPAHAAAPPAPTGD